MKVKSKRWIIRAIILFTLVSGLSACVGQGTATPRAMPTSKPTPKPTPTPTPGLNLLIEAQGQVFLKREGRTDYVPVSFGVEVRRGDLVRPSEGQAIKILCADLSLRTVTRESGCPCKLEEEPVLLHGEIRLLTPKAASAFIPYILHPRSTKVLDAHPLLRWYDTGAGGYTVKIIKDGRSIWSRSGVTVTELYYPDDARKLRPWVDYLLSVTDEDSGHNSGEDPAKDLGFQVLSGEKWRIVQARRDEIMALPLDDSARNFAMAVYCAGEGLCGEALALLDEVSRSVSSPAVQLWRGKLLLAMHLPNEAESAYQAALTGATADDLESRATAYTGLWCIGRDEDHLEQALKLYQTLGDNVDRDALCE